MAQPCAQSSGKLMLTIFENVRIIFIPLYFVPFLGSPRIFLKMEEPLNFFERKVCTGTQILLD